MSSPLPGEPRLGSPLLWHKEIAIKASEDPDACTSPKENAHTWAPRATLAFPPVPHLPQGLRLRLRESHPYNRLLTSLTLMRGGGWGDGTNKREPLEGNKKLHYHV